MKKVVFLIVTLIAVGCGNSDCPSGVNTTNPNCPGFVGNSYNYGNGQYNPQYPYQQYPQYPQQPGYGYPQQPGYGYPQQPGYGYPQYPRY